MKYFYRFLTTIVIVLIILALALYLNRTWFISKIFSSKLKTKVSIEKIYITSKSIDVRGIKIYNKFGDKKKMPYAITIETLQINAPLKNYLNRHVEIKDILVSNVKLYIQFTTKNHSKTNWSELIDSFNPEKESYSEKNSETFSTIELLEIKKIKAYIGSIFDSKIMKRSVPDLTFKKINTQKGHIFKKIAQTVISHLVIHIQDIITFPIKIPFEVIKSLFSPHIHEIKPEEASKQSPEKKSEKKEEQKQEKKELEKQSP